MGGRGSTRWGAYRKRYTVEQSLALSIGDITGHVRPISGQMTRCTYIWYERRQPSGSMVVDLDWTDSPQPVLWIFFTLPGIDEPLWQRLGLTSTPIGKNGGVRWWMLCPECHGKFAKLYLPPDASSFMCRHCHDLTYRSCQESHCHNWLHGLLASKMGITVKEAKRVMDRMPSAYERRRARVTVMDS